MTAGLQRPGEGFCCCVCGQANPLPLDGVRREGTLCTGCGANARFRGIVRLLAQHLGLDPARPLLQWPAQPAVTGIGLSDWVGYAGPLAKCFSYRNTFYDREPRLDIARQPPDDLTGQHDFVICSDVFEHIAPPLQPAFDHLLALLRPEGMLIFSVPYTRQRRSIEHFRDLHDHRLEDGPSGPQLVNRRPDGRVDVYRDLCFHGGEGATLEMRIFCEADVLQHLRSAGFVDITVHNTATPGAACHWAAEPQADPSAPYLHAHLISAHRP